MAKIKNDEKMVLMSLRIEEQAKIERVPYTTMARTLLDRMKYIDEQIKQFDKKRGNK